jgi:hypothetical protein
MKYMADANDSPTKGRRGGYGIVFENNAPKWVLLEKSIAARPNKILIGIIQNSVKVRRDNRNGIVGVFTPITRLYSKP